jgi:hypothetical protein
LFKARFGREPTKIIFIKLLLLLMQINGSFNLIDPTASNKVIGLFLSFSVAVALSAATYVSSNPHIEKTPYLDKLNPMAPVEEINRIIFSRNKQRLC